MIPFADIVIAFKWLAVMYFCGLAGILVFAKAGSTSKVRYNFGKIGGIIMIAAITWLLSIFKIAPFNALTIASVIFIISLAAIIFRRKKIINAFQKHWRSYLVIEIVFLALFFIAVLIRSSIPKIEGIEKFMDAAILSGLIRHSTGIPIDTWYAPETINYYYFGHWIIAMFAKLSQTQIGYAFNLGFASTIALAGSAFFLAGWQLSKKIGGGLLAVFLVFFASNFHPFINIIKGVDNYFFYNSGRFIEQEINEYPYYSVVLGDLHAHMLSLMLTSALVMAVILIVMEVRFQSKIILAAASGVITGMISLTNSFDVITSALLFGLLFLWLLISKKLSFKNTIILGVSFAVPFLVLFAIIMANFHPAVGGIAFQFFKTPLIHFVWQFGAVLILVGVSIFVIIKSGLFKTIDKDNLIVTSIILIAGLAMMLIPQFMIFKDIYFYENPPFARANTVFKLWYAAWMLISLASAIFVSLWLSRAKTKKSIWGGYVFLCLVLIVMLFGTNNGLKLLKDDQPNTLNGLNYVSIDDPDKFETIKWATNNIKGQPIVAQAYGDSYSEQSWFSSYTGLPTNMGWRSHEWGWRYSSDRWELLSYRTDAIKKFYESTTSEELSNQLAALKASYVLLGPDERSVFKIQDNAFVEAFGEPVFSNQSYRIYRTN